MPRGKYIQGVGRDDCLDVWGVSELTGYSPDTIRCKHDEMGIPSMLIAGRRCFIESEVLEWKRQQLAEERRKLEQAEAMWAARQYAIGARSAA